MNSIDRALRPKLAPHVRLKIDAVSGEPILLYPEGILILNDTAHEIAKRCTGELTVGELLKALMEKFEAPEDILRADLLENLEQLQQKNLLLLVS